MNPPSSIELNICRAYIRHIQEHFPVPTYESGQFVLILQRYEWHLKRIQKGRPATLDQLGTLKNGIRQAEYFINHILTDMPSWAASDIYQLLCEIALELSKEVIAVESQYPDLKAAFDHERAEYRRMKQEAEEALEL